MLRENPMSNKLTFKTTADQIKFTAGSIFLLILSACGGNSSGDGLNGTVSIDGSSTVYPITEAIAEEFLNEEPEIRVTVGVSGTGGGFKKFLASETDINDASRTIKASEEETAKAAGINYLEIPVAYDGLAVVIHPANDFVDNLSVEELRRIWQPGSTVDSWDDVRPEWPAEPIRLYGPGTDSGTFDYFTEAVNGESGASRPDYTASEDDNVLVQGISGDTNSLGFFGYAYYVANKDRLKLVPIDNGEAIVSPEETTIKDGSYSPLSRPIFIYVNTAALAKPAVATFIDFYLSTADQVVHETGYVSLGQQVYQEQLERVAATKAALGSGN
jgi:phosphate transport system substrate-binding protein